MAVTICSQCPNPRYGRSRLCRQCLRPIQAAMMKKRRETNKELGVCADCAKPIDTGKKLYCLKCLKRHRRLCIEYKQRLKLQCFEAYGGPVCACCGETELSFLTLDHVHNNGNHERRKLCGTNLRGGGHTYYQHLKNQGFPQKGYQVLCHNCQWGKKLCGTCPHKAMTPLTL